MSNDNEQVLVVDRTAAEEILGYGSGNLPNGLLPLAPGALGKLAAAAYFTDRGPAEDNSAMKQLVVYTAVRHDGKVLCYERGKVGAEARLHAKRSYGVGGHINPIDWPSDTGVRDANSFAAAMLRELGEEVFDKEATPIDDVADYRILGLVNDESNEVGAVHLGLVYLLDLESIEGCKFEEAMRDPAWDGEDDIYRRVSSGELETWSQLIAPAVSRELGVPI